MLCLFLGVVYAVLIVFRQRITTKATYRGFPQGYRDQDVRYDFDDASFASRTPVSEETVRYHAICEVVESDDLYALFVGKRQAHLLSKAGFLTTGGSPEAFRTFIEEKTGKKIRRVRA